MDILENVQSLFFEVSEHVPNDKYILIMDELLKLYIHLKYKPKPDPDSNSDLSSETSYNNYRIDIDTFDEISNNIVNEYYDHESEAWIFSYDLIYRLRCRGHPPEDIADKMNWFFAENGYFYCPVYDDLLYHLNYLGHDNFIHIDYKTFCGHFDEEAYQTTLKSWVENRFKNALKGL
jgi:hypothetical protein